MAEPTETTDERFARYVLIKERRARTDAFINDPDLMEYMCGYVANGGTIITLTRAWNIRYGDVLKYIRAEPEREKQYSTALNDRVEWSRESILAEVRNIAHMDIRDAYDKEGKLLPPNKWPEHLARAINSHEDGKLKLYDKLKALDMLGKNAGLFTEKHEVKVSRLEDLIEGTINPVDKKPQQ